MKQLVMMACLCLWVWSPSVRAQQKEFKETISKELSFSNTTDNTVVVKNVFGSINVEGYQGDKVLVEVERKITADNSQDLELGKKELQLKIIQEDNRIIFHPDAPYINFKVDGLRYSWCNNNQNVPYDHALTFNLKVPHSVQVNVSTVNNGVIDVENIRSKSIVAENINGGITLNNISGKTWVSCINGPVDISYAENPKEESVYHTINGDITIAYQKALSANITFKSMNGEMYTDFDINKQFVKTIKNTGDTGKPKHKFEANPVVQIGGGQVDFDIETLNGDVFIKKI
ncbi:hypothetical protein J0X14_11615 [Muricauda sp. CAU 1633]|uniref:DUF4097 family beta strand repeat-containing protein n=1 Tax=Allomuricauda sp. CAU 1633 TaxID=2816036 RepID=UPI001A8C0F06|nr:DUF4097 family beta strand repeat-containing protein [Muricauda sp. CAU 1633]MBO0322945.1 hypothetical protein [Muricauda sp. CAU 1633]